MRKGVDAMVSPGGIQPRHRIVLAVFVLSLVALAFARAQFASSGRHPERIVAEARKVLEDEPRLEIDYVDLVDAERELEVRSRWLQGLRFSV